MLRKSHLLLVLIAVLAAACSQLGGAGNLVPTTGDTASDASAVQRFIPNLSAMGYTSVEAQSIQTALSSVSGGASLLTGNPAAAALVAQIDGMISCYRNVGALDARVYYQANIANLVQGTVPSVGALAVINQDRVINNFLSCALGSGQGIGAQTAASQICSGSGQIVVDGETIAYLYAATNRELCNLMISPFQGR
ncbi:MAG: hypothetical protein IPK19_22460 [Chloroflexi bacterium]|nr:hypothetical protein [Chloroflexota bacterium]